MINKIKNIPYNLAKTLSFTSINHPAITFSAIIIFIGFFLYFSAAVKVDNSYNSFFIPTDKSFIEYKTFNDNFGSDEFVYIVYRSLNDENVLSSFMLEICQKLTDDLSQVPYSKNIYSLTKKDFAISEGDEIKLLNHKEIINEYGQDFDFRDFIFRKPFLANNLITEDGLYGAIFIEMTKTFLDDEENTDGYSRQVSEKIYEILSGSKYDMLEITAIGDPLINHVYRAS